MSIKYWNVLLRLWNVSNNSMESLKVCALILNVLSCDRLAFLVRCLWVILLYPRPSQYNHSFFFR